MGHCGRLKGVQILRESFIEFALFQLIQIAVSGDLQEKQAFAHPMGESLVPHLPANVRVAVPYAQRPLHSQTYAAP